MSSAAEREAEDELRLAAENRIRNMFWTVSGNYELDIRPDTDTFLRSRALALYDAVKQGAFAAHFDTRALALYVLRKSEQGADRSLLTEILQLCVDAAAFPIADRERGGVRMLRQAAFRDLLRLDDFSGAVGPVRRSIALRFLGEPDNSPDYIRTAARDIEALKHAGNTEELIAAVDRLYNAIAAPSVRSGPGAQGPAGFSHAETAAYDRSGAMSDEMMQAVLDSYMSVLKDELLRTRTLKPLPRRPLAELSAEESEEPPEPAPEEAEKIYAFMERQFGRSFLSRQEQARLNARLCTGIHRRCSLYLTEGILSNPAVKNTQYLRTSMQSLKNQTYYDMKQLQLRRGTAELTAMLRQVQLLRQDTETARSDYGTIVPARLWKVGRVRDDRLFDRVSRHPDSSFVLDILLDGSSSQNIRQPQVAAQASVLSRALCGAGIPNRVQSFCSYWDYTTLHRFRDYDDGADSCTNILQYRAFGENRDGLAIRAVCDSLKNRPEENRLLVILSDGRPNHLGSPRPGCRKPTPYLGEDAVRDTAFEIRKARNQGIRVLGIFVGSEEDLTTERKIFGKDFAYTRSISSFAHIVGRYLCRLMEQE